jgi:3-isopropylmalate dehydrogenase
VISDDNIYTNILPGWGNRESSSPYVIGVLKGEGVGPEVIDASLPLLEAIEQCTTHKFELHYGGKIGLDARRESGEVLSNEVIGFSEAIFARNGALFCGPGGGSFVYQMRKRFDLFCKLIPLKPLPALVNAGVMKPEHVSSADIMVIRENTGGLYQGTSSFENKSGGTHASQIFGYDEHQVRRILSVSLDVARLRSNKVCVVYKPGGAESISRLWQELADDLFSHSGVQLRFLEVDTAAYLMLAEAGEFDVVVTPNMFGDVLGDCGALLLSSRGMSYSANYADNGAGVYQTAHGAAYDLAGKDVANPIGQMQSLAMLLKENFGLASLHDEILIAINEVLASGIRTRDIMEHDSKRVSTTKMGEYVKHQLLDQLQGRAARRQSIPLGKGARQTAL